MSSIEPFHVCERKYSREEMTESNKEHVVSYHGYLVVTNHEEDDVGGVMDYFGKTMESMLSLHKDYCVKVNVEIPKKISGKRASYIHDFVSTIYEDVMLPRIDEYAMEVYKHTDVEEAEGEQDLLYFYVRGLRLYSFKAWFEQAFRYDYKYHIEAFVLADIFVMEDIGKYIATLTEHYKNY